MKEIIFRIFLEGGFKFLFLISRISFGASKPARYNMECSAILSPRSDSFQRLTSEIDLTKTKRGRSEIELTVDVIRLQSRDLGPPGYGFLGVLFLGCVRQNVKRWKRIAMEFQHLARETTGGPEVFLFQHR